MKPEWKPETHPKGTSATSSPHTTVSFEVWTPTKHLRWVVDGINDRYLQQLWRSDHGEEEWRAVPTVATN